MKTVSILMSTLILSTGIFMFSGCSSHMVNIAPTPPANYKQLGSTEATACGNMGFLGTAYNFAPIMLNSRVDRAYKKAVSRIPDATGLINVTLQESWYWWFFATLRCTTISGEAIQ